MPVEQGSAVAVSGRDEFFGPRKCLINGHVDAWALPNETARVRWASGSIKVCTGLEIDED